MIGIQRMKGLGMKNIARIGLAMIFALALPALAVAQDFSADIISRAADGKVSKSKLYWTENRQRFDSTVELAGGKTMETHMIIDLREKLIYLVEPQQKRILVNHALQMISSTSASGSAVSNPCEGLMRAINPMVVKQQFKCTRIGSESVNGRAADKWQMWFGNKPAYLWVDSQVKAASKWTMPDGSSGEVQNLKVGPQPASLFELPADYRRQDLPH